jgi:hypothetical protein
MMHLLMLLKSNLEFQLVHLVLGAQVHLGVPPNQADQELQVDQALRTDHEVPDLLQQHPNTTLDLRISDSFPKSNFYSIESFCLPAGPGGPLLPLVPG